MALLSLYQTKTSSGLVKAVSSKISILSLDMFLFSYIIDSVVYPYFKDLFFIDQAQFGKFFFVIVPIVFVLSFGGGLGKKPFIQVAGRDSWPELIGQYGKT